jgi:HEAT repeat protein
MQNKSENLDQILRDLADPQKSIPFSRLYAFSDLARKQLAEFRETWDTLPTDSRQRIIRALAELAESSFEVNYDAIYRHCLTDADAEVRAIAIQGLWENEQVSLIGSFLNMLRTDPSPQVRAAAASALGRFVLAGELDKIEEVIQNRIVTELMTTIYLVDESLEVRRRAIESIAYAPSPEIEEVLEQAYANEDALMRLSAVVGMGRSCETRWASIILPELENESPAMRYEAAWASGELGLREAVPHLGRLIDDPDRQVSHASIWALGQIGGDQAKQVLRRAFQKADEDTQVALEDALAEAALLDGDLDLLLYEFDDEDESVLLDDEFVSLWSADDKDDVWDPDER